MDNTSDLDMLLNMVNRHADARKNMSSEKTVTSANTESHNRPNSKTSDAYKFFLEDDEVDEPRKCVLKSNKVVQKASIATVCLVVLTTLGATLFVNASKGANTPAPQSPTVEPVGISAPTMPDTERSQDILETMVDTESIVDTTPAETEEIVVATNNYDNPSEHIHTQKWSDGKTYYVCDEDYVIYLANQALSELKDAIAQTNPDSDYLRTLNAGFIDATLLTATASKESDFRIADTDGVIVHNGDTAFGMTQGTRPTMETVNNNFRRYGIQFDENTLKDPLEALKFTACIYAINATNYLSKSLDIFDPNNADTARWYCACSYFHGGGGANKFYKDGTLRDQGYPQRLMDRAYKLAEKYSPNADIEMG